MTPSPTSTPNSVFPTDLPDPCMNLGMIPNGFFGKEMSIHVWNNNPDWVEIVWIHITWPDFPNGSLEEIKFDGDLVWQGPYPPSEAWITSFFAPTFIPDFSSRTLSFFFENDASIGGYWIEIGFDNSCVISGGA